MQQARLKTSSTPFVLRFREIGIDDVPLVGGKNASLGEMIGALADQGVRVPDGFATTADAYRTFVDDKGLAEPIADGSSATGAAKPHFATPASPYASGFSMRNSPIDWPTR